MQRSTGRHGRGGSTGSPLGAHWPPRSPASRKISQPTTPASTDPARIPILASATSTGSSRASSVTNSATVNPIPDRAAPPTSWPQRSVSGTAPRRVFSASHVPAITPIGLPTTSPATMPQVIGDVPAARSVSAVSNTPALASTNSGTMT